MTIAELDTALVRRKVLGAIEWKTLGDGVPEGSFRSTIATFDIVDKDAEVTLPGAMPEGKKINISAYGHSSWGGFSAAMLPVGGGIVHQDATHAFVEGRFYLDTPQGKQHYDTLKNQMADGVPSEWSYAFAVEKSSTDAAQLAKWPGAVRILEKLDVFEASPVLRGAGEGTGTEFVKSVTTLADRGEQLVAVTSEFLVHAHAAVSMRAKEGRVLSQANADRVASVADSLTEAAGVLRKLLEEAKPAPADEGKSASSIQDLARATELELIFRGMTAA